MAFSRRADLFAGQRPPASAEGVAGGVVAIDRAHCSLPSSEIESLPPGRPASSVWLRRVRAGPGRGGALHAAPNVRSPGFLHVDGVLQDSCSRNLIHHFTVIFAAHASFVQVAVGRDGAEPLVNEVDGHVQARPASSSASSSAYSVAMRAEACSSPFMVRGRPTKICTAPRVPPRARQSPGRRSSSSGSGPGS